MSDKVVAMDSPPEDDEQIHGKENYFVVPFFLNLLRGSSFVMRVTIGEISEVIHLTFLLQWPTPTQIGAH
jgi:hypothetical protein